MIVALAGLPGTGKSTLARVLAAHLDGVVLDKDRVRAALFPPGVLDYSAAQNDFAMEVVYRTAAFLLEREPARPVILDGRTFSQHEQVVRLRIAAEEAQAPLYLIECTCAPETARRRLEADLTAGAHPAEDRDFALYRRLEAHFDPLPEPKLVLDTDIPLEICLERALDYLPHP